MSQQPNRVLRSLAVAAASSAGILALAAAPAAAQACYPPGPNCVTTTRPGVTATVTISDRTVGRGRSITISVTGFRSDRVILVQIRSHPRDLGTMTANAQGQATGNFTIPADMELGRHDIVASGEGANGLPLEVRTRITIVADQAADARVLGATASNQTSGSSGSSGNAAGGSLAKTGATFVLPAAAAGLALVGSGVLLGRTVKRRKPVPA